MPKKDKSVFICQACGHETVKWMGRCPECNQWNSMVEEILRPQKRERLAPAGMGPEKITAVSLEPQKRLRTGIAEFDRILGGGIVPGSMVLVGGDPGIGKSTIILQVLDKLAQSGHRALYLSGEESAQQIRMRGDRLHVHSDLLYVMTGTCIEDFFDRAAPFKPQIVAVDSIQTFYTTMLPSAPGSVGQVREVASRLMAYAKETGVPVFLVGHVTKDGAIAGPKILEHLVDTVLYFEGERGHIYKVLRSVKNRYGSTNEIGVFEMKDSGLEEVGNPSRIFLEERPENVSGSAVISCVEGTRPLLVEIQALVSPSPFGMPRRTAVGVDQNRISLLVAVLGKRLGIELGDQDIFVNVAGGLKVDEPAADLGIVSAMLSSFLNRPLERNLAMFGEVGLAGEIRGVSQPDMRIAEAGKLGFDRCLLSHSNLKGSNRSEQQLHGVGSVQELFEWLFQ